MLRATKPSHTRVQGARWLPKNHRGYDFLWDTKNAVDNGMILEPGWFPAMNFHPPPPRYPRSGLGKDLPKIIYHEDQLKAEYMARDPSRSIMWMNRTITGDLTWEKHPADLFAAKQQEFIDRGYPKMMAWKLADRDERMRELAYEMEKDYALAQTQFLGIPYVPPTIHIKSVAKEYEKVDTKARSEARARGRDALEALVKTKKEEPGSKIVRGELRGIHSEDIMDFLEVNPEDAALFDFRDVFGLPEDIDQFVAEMDEEFKEVAEPEWMEEAREAEERRIEGNKELIAKLRKRGMSEDIIKEIFPEERDTIRADPDLVEEGEDYDGQGYLTPPPRYRSRKSVATVQDLKALEIHEKRGKEEAIQYMKEQALSIFKQESPKVADMIERGEERLHELRVRVPTLTRIGLDVLYERLDKQLESLPAESQRRIKAKVAENPLAMEEEEFWEYLSGYLRRQNAGQPMPEGNEQQVKREQGEDQIRATNDLQEEGEEEGEDQVRATNDLQEGGEEREAQVQGAINRDRLSVIANLVSQRLPEEEEIDTLLRAFDKIGQGDSTAAARELEPRREKEPPLDEQGELIKQALSPSLDGGIKEEVDRPSPPISAEELLEHICYDYAMEPFSQAETGLPQPLSVQQKYRFHKLLQRPLTRTEVEDDLMFRKEITEKFLKEIGFTGAIQDDVNVQDLVDQVFEEEAVEVQLSPFDKDLQEFEKQIDQKLAKVRKFELGNWRGAESTWERAADWTGDSTEMEDPELAETEKEDMDLEDSKRSKPTKV